ncbi:hypothetical protein [Nostoc sp. CCY0012]|uniref:hypothetical protein n=1 Tax=Nostoc sp. CCY0012 TaxID=1056123 RepID=UPI0039C654A9
MLETAKKIGRMVLCIASVSFIATPAFAGEFMFDFIESNTGKSYGSMRLKFTEPENFIYEKCFSNFRQGEFEFNLGFDLNGENINFEEGNLNNDICLHSARSWKQEKNSLNGQIIDENTSASLNFSSSPGEITTWSVSVPEDNCPGKKECEKVLRERVLAEGEVLIRRIE